ncbi:MAG: sulfatase-like hydrolase/transferase [Planctomycetota bacterium]|jgi:arylsulfatase A-like enzyme
MQRRDFLKAAGAGAVSLAMGGCVAGSAGSADTKSEERPNIVFIIVDDMGWADLGCYGGKHIKTPNINRMAKEGVRFTDAYSGCTVCAPARSVLMTGLHMGHTSVRGNTGGIPLRDEDVTVAEVLKRNGYATGGFGKWGLGDVGTAGVPEKKGFDEFFGYYHQVHAHDYWTEYLWCNSRKVPMTGEPGSMERYTHNRIFEQTLNFIRKNKDRPFFCYAPWTPPHGKYQIPESEPAWALYKDKDWPKNAKVVAAMDTMLDRHVGELLSSLKELGIDERTIVFFCSDNGAAQRFDGVLDSSGPLKGYKRSMYEGGIRVPLIARWPGKIKAGAASNLPCYFADMMPTFVELAGSRKDMPPNIDGISIVPTLTGRGRQKKHEFMYWEWHRYNWGRRKNVADGLMQAVRMGKWKVVRRGGDAPFELYDLSRDIGEKNNIAAEHPHIVARIDKCIKQNRIPPRPQIEPERPKGKRFM